MSQVWAQTCDFCKSHNFWPKLVTFRFKLVTFTKGHKFKVVTFAQSCDLSKLVTFTKGHKFKLVTIINSHKFGPKGHKFGPKVVTFTKCHKFQLVTFCKGRKFMNFLIIPKYLKKYQKVVSKSKNTSNCFFVLFWKGENWSATKSSNMAARRDL